MIVVDVGGLETVPHFAEEGVRGHADGVAVTDLEGDAGVVAVVATLSHHRYVVHPVHGLIRLSDSS